MKELIVELRNIVPVDGQFDMLRHLLMMAEMETTEVIDRQSIDHPPQLSKGQRAAEK